MSNEFKKQLAEEFEIKKRKAEETVKKIYAFFEKGTELTEQEKLEFLAIDESTIPDDICHMIYHVLKRYIQTGEIEDFETYSKKFMLPKEIELKRNPEKLQKVAEQRKEEKKNEREI